jgi:hypothetical protein
MPLEVAGTNPAQLKEGVSDHDYLRPSLTDRDPA